MATITKMPPIPHFFFLYIEPCLCFFGGALQPILKPTAITTLLPASLAGRNTKSLEPTRLELLLGLQSAVLMFMISLLTIVVMRWGDQRVRRGYVVVSALTDIPQ